MFISLFKNGVITQLTKTLSVALDIYYLSITISSICFAQVLLSYE